MSDLPNCPLCGGEATRMSGGGVCCQSDRYCELNEGDGLYFSETSWRKLAAEPLPETGQAVLIQAERWFLDGDAPSVLGETVYNWRISGRPGLPPEVP